MSGFKITTSICFVLCWNVVVGQQPKIDSLRQLLNRKDDTVKVNILNQLASFYIKVDLDTAFTIASNANSLAKEISFTRGEYQSYSNIRKIYGRRGDFLNALKAAYNLLAVAEQINAPLLIVQSKLALGSEYNYLHYYPKAIENITEALRLCERINNKKILAEIYNELGNLHTEGTKNYEQAEAYYNRAKTLHEELNQKHSVGVALINLGELYETRKDRKRDHIIAQKYLRSALKIEEELKNDFFISYIIGTMADVRFNMDDYKSADSMYRKALKYSEDLKLTGNQIAWLIRLGKVSLKTNKYVKAIDYYNEALRRSGSKVSFDKEIGIYSGLADAYEGLGDFKRALENKKRVVIAKDSLVNKQEKAKLFELQAQYQIEEHEQKIAQLENENKIKKIELKQGAAYRNILVAGVALLIFIVLYVVYNLNSKSKLIKVLTRQKKEIELQNNRIKNINEVLELRTLRAQINPHFLFNALNSIQYYISKNDQENAINYLQKFTKLVRRVLESSMVLSISLKEEMEMLKNYIELEQLRFNFQFDYKISALTDLDIDRVTLPYLLIQPFVENSILHGLRNINYKGLVSIHFSKQNESLICTIDDNGIGRKAAAEKGKMNGHKSVGMSITQDRINKIGKYSNQKVSVNVIDKEENGVAAGTRVEILIPLEEEMMPV